MLGDQAGNGWLMLVVQCSDQPGRLMQHQMDLVPDQDALAIDTNLSRLLSPDAIARIEHQLPGYGDLAPFDQVADFRA